jgi:YVTN family beta-propeller protein
MKRSRQQFIIMIAVSIFGIAAVSCCRADGPYHFVKEIAVGGEGGWDDLSIDAAARRLYVTHATKVVVINIDKGEVVGEIADTPGVHGFAVAPDLGRGFSSNGREDKVSIVDLKTLKTLSKVDTGKNPDAIVYEPGQQEVYAFNGRGDSATVIDAKTSKVVTAIPLPGRPEFAAVDPNAGRVYCNIEDKSEVAAIDTKTHKVVNTWPVAPGEEPSGISIDVARHRVFSGCHNKMMVMSDTTEGKAIANVPIGERVDGGAFDPGLQYAFSSCGDGTVTIAHEDAPGKLTIVQSLTTERGARTMTLDPKTHNIYLPSAKFELQPVPAAGERPQRPKMIPGSFKVLVYGMGNAPKS